MTVSVETGSKLTALVSRWRREADRLLNESEELEPDQEEEAVLLRMEADRLNRCAIELFKTLLGN